MVLYKGLFSSPPFSLSLRPKFGSWIKHFLPHIQHTQRHSLLTSSPSPPLKSAELFRSLEFSQCQMNMIYDRERERQKEFSLCYCCCFVPANRNYLTLTYRLTCRAGVDGSRWEGRGMLPPSQNSTVYF